MGYSYSKVSTFTTCPYKYKVKYLDGLEAIKANESDNALIVGTAMHEAIEGVPSWRATYLKELCISDDKTEDELLKVEVLSERVRGFLNEKFISYEFEKKIETPDGFIGFVDFIGVDENNERWVLDFKYSNSNYYLDSPQVHIYKNVLESDYNIQVDHIGYLLIPKSKIRQKKDETINQFRQRLQETLEGLNVGISEVSYSEEKYRTFLFDTCKMVTANEFPKIEGPLCDYCDYKILCKEGIDNMLIPKNEKVKVSPDSFKKIYLYGAPFVGKTYLANQFEDVLFLNTDGNTKYVDSPRIYIHDIVTMDGRIEKRKLAWELFKEVVNELEIGDGKEYKTIVVDLLEDLYEHCRLYMYKQLKITHESDDSFRAWDKVRQEFLSVIKRLVSLPFNIVLISQEDTSRDLTARGGDKVTAVMPALTEKVARKIAGMVDIVLRVVNDGGDRILQNRPSDVVFGGGRFALVEKQYPCSYESIVSIYNTVSSEENEAENKEAK